MTSRILTGVIAIVALTCSSAEAASGKWITSQSATTQRSNPASKPSGGDPLANLWTCYRKTFELDAAPAWAAVRIAADSKYWLWVNGKMIVFEGSLKRGPTREDSYIDTVDVGPALVKGKNTIAILAWYFGKEGFSHISSGMPGLLVESDMVPLASEGTWKAKTHEAFGGTKPPHPNFRLAESNVRFDARKEMPGWMNADFDDADWPAAVEAGAAGSKPWGRLISRPIPLIKFSELRDYESAKEAEGKLVCKLPYDAQVTPYLKIDAPAGLTIDIRTDSYITGEATVRSEYVTRAGVQEFETPAWMSGHEVICALPAGVKVIAVKYRESGYDTNLAGEFDCDDPFYDALWKKAQRTLYVNMRDTYFDCPDRERAQWWGDIVNDLIQSSYGLDRKSDRLTAKGLLEVAAWQRPDGTIFSPVPAGNWDKELPPQMLAAAGWYGAWTYYLHSGDKRTIKQIYPAIKKYLDVWKLDDNGLAVHRAGEWDWEDWGNHIDAPLLDSAWLCLALKSAVEMARLSGAEADVAGYEAKMATIRAAYDKRFWTGKEYRSPDYKGDTDDRGNAMAILSGLAPAERHAALREVLMKQRNCSPYMERFVSEAQFTIGDTDGALTRMKERYTPMVEDSLSTLWEQFNKGEGTYNHAWSGGPLSLLSQYVAGVSPTSPGYATFEIRPRMGHLKKAMAKVATPKGVLRARIAREEKRVTMKVTSPGGIKGRVMIPVEGMELGAVHVNGKEAKFERDGGYAVIEITTPLGGATIEPFEIEAIAK